MSEYSFRGDANDLVCLLKCIFEFLTAIRAISEAHCAEIGAKKRQRVRVPTIALCDMLGIVQLVEQRIVVPYVVGSIPTTHPMSNV